MKKTEMSKTGLKDNGSMTDAVNMAMRARTAPANTMADMPASGPKPEPTMTNGVPAIKEKNMSY